MEPGEMYEYRRPNVTVDPDSLDVEAYLRALGFLIGPSGVGVGLEVVDGVSGVLVRADLDPNIPKAVIDAALDAYTPPTDDPLKIARGYLVGRLAALQAKPLNTLTALEKDLLAILIVLKASR